MFCRFLRPLGAGQFGSVDAGIWRKVYQDIPVALKTLRKGSSEKDKVKFLQEAVTMAQFRHPNVVTLFGIVSEGEPVSMNVCVYILPKITITNSESVNNPATYTVFVFIEAKGMLYKHE